MGNYKFLLHENYEKYIPNETTKTTLEYYTNMIINDPIKLGMRDIFITMLLKKYNLDVRNKNHIEEVNLASKLMRLFGYDIIIKLFFLKSKEEEMKLIINEMGEEAAGLYWYICDLAINSYNEYLNKKLKKADYSKIYKIVDNYNIYLDSNIKMKSRDIFKKILFK